MERKLPINIWLSLIDDDTIRNQAFENKRNYENKATTSINKAIKGAFDWLGSPQKHTYWMKISESFVKLRKPKTFEDTFINVKTQEEWSIVTAYYELRWHKNSIWNYYKEKSSIKACETPVFSNEIAPGNYVSFDQWVCKITKIKNVIDNKTREIKRYEDGSPLIDIKTGYWYKNKTHSQMDYGRVSKVEFVESEYGYYYLSITFDKIIINGIMLTKKSTQSNSSFDKQMIQVDFKEIPIKEFNSITEIKEFIQIFKPSLNELEHVIGNSTDYNIYLELKGGFSEEKAKILLNKPEMNEKEDSPVSLKDMIIGGGFVDQISEAKTNPISSKPEIIKKPPSITEILKDYKADLAEGGKSSSTTKRTKSKKEVVSLQPRTVKRIKF